jgi:hypothetical protein
MNQRHFYTAYISPYHHNHHKKTKEVRDNMTGNVANQSQSMELQ